MTTSINIEKKRGDTRRIVFLVKDQTGAVVDISLWTGFTLTVDPEKAPADALNNLFAAVGAFVTDGTDGRVGFPPPGTTAPGSYYYDAQAVDDNAGKVTIAEGKYKITQDITKV